MRILFLAALLATAPSLAQAQSFSIGGYGKTDCDYIRNNPNRPDCLGYNPFHPEAAKYAELARRAPPVYFDPFGMYAADPGIPPRRRR